MKKELENKILDFLYENFYVNRETNTIDYLWDYNEILEAKYILRRIEQNDCTNIAELFDAIEEDLYKTNYNVVYQYTNEVIENIKSNFKEKELCILFNCNSEQLNEEIMIFLEKNGIFFSWNLKEANIENIPFQIALVSKNSKFLEDDYFRLSPFQTGYDKYTYGNLNMGNIKNKKIDTLKKIKNEYDETVNCETLDLLLQSQGYKLEDLYNDEKVKKSIFLKSLIEEICNYYTDLSGMSITFAGKVKFDDYFLLKKKNINIILPSNVDVGFVNFHNGSGCSMNIKLEKDIVIPRENIINMKYSYNYNVDDIFGFYLKDVNMKSNNVKTDYKITSFDKLIENIIKKRDVYKKNNF